MSNIKDFLGLPTETTIDGEFEQEIGTIIYSPILDDTIRDDTFIRMNGSVVSRATWPELASVWPDTVQPAGTPPGFNPVTDMYLEDCTILDDNGDQLFAYVKAASEV